MALPQLTSWHVDGAGGNQTGRRERCSLQPSLAHPCLMGLHYGISDLLLSLCCDNALMHLDPPRLLGKRKRAGEPRCFRKVCPQLPVFEHPVPRKPFDDENLVSARVAKPTETSSPPERGSSLGRPAHLAGHIPAAQGRARRRLGGTAPASARATCASTHESLPYQIICSIKVFASKPLLKPSLGIIKACSVPRVFWIQ